MNWFDKVMDSCKTGLALSSKNLKLFIPNAVSLAITVVAIIIFCVGAFIFGVIGIFNNNINNMSLIDIVKSLLPIIVLFLLLFGIILPIIYTMVEAGVLAMCNSIVITGKAGKAEFFAGVKKYWVGILIGVSIVSIMLILFYIVGFALFLAGGILTFGYGFIFAWVIFNIFYGTWGVIMVIEDISAWEAIKKGVNFGKKNFWALFIIFLTPALIAPCFSSIVNSIPLLGAIVVPVIGLVIYTYFKLVLLIYYCDVYEKNQAASDIESGLL